MQQGRRKAHLEKLLFVDVGKSSRICGCQPSASTESPRTDCWGLSPAILLKEDCGNLSVTIHKSPVILMQMMSISQPGFKSHRPR